MAITAQKNWQDIHIADEELWKNFQQLWANGSYSQAIAVLQNASLVRKWNSADLLNTMTANIVELQNLNDPTYKASQPITSSATPSSPTNETIWFEVK